MLQSEALDILKLGYNVFLTGAAGAGKTYVLNAFVAHLREHSVPVAVTASTGIAATHLSGQTIHSWCGFGTKEALTEADLEVIRSDRRLRSAIGKARVLIIDEISMLHSRQLDMVDRITKMVRGGDDPFGGLQVVLCGDFFQLPPVTKGVDPQKFAYLSQAWQTGNFTVCYLHEQHRQLSDPLLDVLNQIRSGTAGEHTKIPLRTRYKKPPIDPNGEPFVPTLLYAKNVNVDSLNDAELARLPGEPRAFEMTCEGFRAHVDALKRNCLAPEKLFLKPGAQVMFVKNSPEQLFVNGTRGVVESFDPVDGWPEVRTLDGEIICAEPEEWRFEEGGITRASVTQVPLRLAWAITIHKSQGMTLDAVEVDLSDAFEPGMGYVALSCVRTFAGLKLMGLNEMALRVHPEVLKRDEEFQKESLKAASTLQEMDVKDRDGRQRQTLIVRFGAAAQSKKTPRPHAEPAQHARKKPRSKPERTPTHIVTRDLVCQGKPLEVIAESRGLSVGTIISHLEKLKGDRELPDIRHLREGISDEDFEAIFSALSESEDGKLRPVWEKLGSKFAFDTIRLVRLFVGGEESSSSGSA
jgi:hypothetical protein